MANKQIIDEFPKTSMNRQAGDIWAAAARGPVSLSDHGKSRFVLMSREQFDQLVSRGKSRKVRATAAVPQKEADKLVAYLQSLVDDYEQA